MEYQSVSPDNSAALMNTQERRTTGKPLSRAAQVLSHTKESEDDELMGLSFEERLHEYLHEPRSRSGFKTADSPISYWVAARKR